jgi:DHA1 family multidrug resistance protein-like MFS transporter
MQNKPLIEKFTAFLGIERNLIVLSLTSALIVFGRSLWDRVFSIFIYNELKASPEEIGLMFTTSAISAAITMMAIGPLADKYGKKKFIVAGNFLLSLAVFLMAFVQTWVQLLPLVFVFNIAHFYGPISLAMIADSVPAEKRGAALAFSIIFPALTSSLGIATGGVFSAMLNFRAVFIASSLLYLLSAILRCIFLKEANVKFNQDDRTTLHIRGFKSFLRREGRQIQILMIILYLNALAEEIYYPYYYALYASEILRLAVSQIAFASAISMGIWPIFCFIGGKLSDKYGRKKIVAVSLIPEFTLLIGFLYAPNALFVYFISATMGAFEGFSEPAWDAVLIDITPEKYRATVFCAISTFEELILNLGPLIGGLSWSVFGPKSPFFIASALSAICLITLTLFFKESNKTN